MAGTAGHLGAVVTSHVVLSCHLAVLGGLDLVVGHSLGAAIPLFALAIL